MTYIASLDPNSPENVRAQAHAEAWDAECPEWEEMSLDPEDRTLVSEDDVADAHTGFVRRYGSDDPGRYFPGVDGE